MRRVFFAIGLCAAVLDAQTPSAAIQAGRLTTPAAASKVNIAVPTLGLVADPSGAGLLPIRGTTAAPVLGDLLPKPAGVNQVFLPPRQHYALVEQTSPEAIAIWHLARRHIVAGKDVLDVIPGTHTHPDSIAFSPMGKAAAVYSSSSGCIQVITGLPGEPVVQALISTEGLQSVGTIVLSDDGQVVLAAGSGGRVALSSDGGAFQMTGWNYSPRALAFVSNSHNLLLSDARQNQLLLLENVEHPSAAPAVIGSGVQADHLATCSHGETIVALDDTNQKLWTVDVKTLSVTPVALRQQADTLLTLRDGHTVLFSTSPLYLMKMADTDAMAAAIDAGKQ